jgi:hypothetical protein
VALRSGWDLPDLTGLLREHGYALGTIEAGGAWPPDESDLEGTINIAATPGPKAGIATGAPLR